MANRGEIARLQEQVVRFRKARDWEQFTKPKDLALSLVLEVSEVLEHFQWKDGDELYEYLSTHRSELGDELADVLVYVFQLAHDLKIDLPFAFEKKMKKNAIKYPISKAKGNHKKYTELT